MKTNISRRSFVLGGTGVLAGLGLSSLVGCNGAGDMATTTAGDGILTAVSAYASDKIQPMPVLDVLSHAVSWHVYEGLYQLDHSNGNVYDGIANGDPKKVDDFTYEIELNLNKRFSDGSPVTPQIVVSVLGKYMADSIYGIILDFIQSVTLLDEDKIKINLKYPIDVELMKRRLCTTLIFKQGSSSNGADESFMGTGPYMLKDADGEDGHTVQFSPNGQYDGKKPPRSPGMHWHVRVDDETRVKQLTDGAAGIVEDIPYRYIDELKAKGFEVMMQDSYSMPALIFNTSHAPFNDVRFRQAVLYAINDEKIIKDLLNGYAEVPHSYLPKFNPNFHECEINYSYNPAKAKELLTAAGRPNLYFNLLINPTAGAEVIVDEIKTNLLDVGITCNAKVQQIRWDNYMRPEYSSDYDAFLVALDPSLLGSDTDILLSTYLGDNVLMHDLTYWASTNEAEFNQLQQYLQVARTLSGKEQAAAWDKAQELIAQQVPIYPIVHRKLATAYNNKMIKDFNGSISSGLYLVDAAPNKK